MGEMVEAETVGAPGAGVVNMGTIGKQQHRAGGQSRGMWRAASPFGTE